MSRMYQMLRIRLGFGGTRIIQCRKCDIPKIIQSFTSTAMRKIENLNLHWSSSYPRFNQEFK